MSLLHEAVKEKIFDSRVAERNVLRGATTRQEYEKFVEALPDEAAAAEWVSLDEIAETNGEVKKKS